MTDVLRTASGSGCYGRRPARCPRILFRSRAKNSSRGYATTFLRRLEPVLGTVAGRDVVDAGGLGEHLRSRHVGVPVASL